MLTSTAAYKTAIADNVRQSRITGTLTLLDNTVYQVTDSIIKQGSLYIDEQCVSGEDLQIGNVYAAEMGISLQLAGISDAAVNGAVLDLDYGLKIADTVTNMLDNGDASGGITGYDTVDATLAVDAGQFKMTNTADGTTPRFKTDADFPGIAGHKYWIRYTITTPRDSTSRFRFMADYGTNYDTLADVPYEVSEVIAASLVVGGFYISPNLTGTFLTGDIIYIDNLSIVDLTADFSDGGEPTAVLMGGYYPAYIDGTVDGVWEDQSLGIFNVTEPKRNGIYIDIVALDNLRRADSKMWVIPSAGTPEENMIAAKNVVSYNPTGSVANSVSALDKLQITIRHPLEGAIKLFFVEELYQNTSDALSVVITPTAYTRYTQVRIKIYLADTTPSKNTAALIQAAIRALAPTYPTFAFDTAVCAALGDWDTTTTDAAVSYLANLTTQYAISTTTAEFNTYPNYALDVFYGDYVTSRDMFMWMGQVNSTFTRMSRADQLEILPLHKASADRTITKTERYKTWVSDATVKVTAIQMTINGVVHVVGTTGLTMELPENPFMTGLSSAAIDTALTAILDDITLAEYKPFEIEWIGDPTLQPGDWITIEDAPTTGGDPTTLITHSTWRYRGRSVLRGVGRTTATIKPVSQESKAIGALKTEMLTMMPSIGQIKFPATQNPSTDVNTLDDYEEGTWIPDLQFGGAKVGITYSQQTGAYQKIGNRVHLTGFIALANKGSSTGTARIYALPFPCINSPEGYGVCSLWLENVSFADAPLGIVMINGSYMQLGEITNAGANTVLDDSNFANNSVVIFTTSYKTTT